MDKRSFSFGIVCGAAGVLFVGANERWSRFKSRHARSMVFRNRYAWSTLVVLLWATGRRAGLFCPASRLKTPSATLQRTCPIPDVGFPVQEK